jgi:hypothetical protein
MRRLAFSLCLVWCAVACAIRFYDRRPLHARVHARAAGQRRGEATVAWIEGPTRASSHGHLVVAAVRVDAKLERFAARRLPVDPGECRLWLEENEEAVQAVARCPGFEPIRLVADGRSLPAIGPYARAGTLYDLYPLTSFDPMPILNSVHPHEPASVHPVLIPFALLALLPLGWAGVRSFRQARRFTGDPVVAGEVVLARPGLVMVRDADRQLGIVVRDDQLCVRPLASANVRSGWAAVHPGAPASIFGATERLPFIGGEEGLRLGAGAILLVGELAAAFRRRLRRAGGRDVALALGGFVLAWLWAVGIV